MLSGHLLRQQTSSPLLYLLWGTALFCAVPVNLHFYLVFPEPRPFLRSRPAASLAALYTLPAAFLAALLVTVARLEWALWRGLDSGPGFDSLRYLFLAYFVVGLASCFLFVASLAQSLRSAAALPERRKQLQVVTFGAVATLVLAGAAVAGLFLHHIRLPAGALAMGKPWSLDALYWLIVLATVCLPAAMAVAILRYRLWELDRPIQRGLVYLILSGALGVLYLAIPGGVGFLFGRAGRDSSMLPLLGFLFTTTVAFQPLRRRAERFVERAFNPEALLTRATIEAFQDEMPGIRNLEPLAARLCQTVAGALGRREVAVVSKSESVVPSGWRILAEVGFRSLDARRLLECGGSIERQMLAGPDCPVSLRLPGADWLELAVPIAARGKLLGFLLVGRADGDWPVSRDERNLLELLAGPLALGFVHAEANDRIDELNRRLEARLAEIEKANGELATELEKNKDLTVNIEDRLAELREANAKLAAQLEANETFAAETREANQRLEAQLEENRRISAKLAAKLGELEDANEKLKAREAENLRLRELAIGENRALKEQIAREIRCPDIVGAEGLAKAKEQIGEAAASGASTLILGETGTGKELIARAIHENSDRRNGPFIAVNLSAIPDALIPDVLFGHLKGAYTGAIDTRPGRFAMAEGGTLFLDEVADISPTVQVALLRVLQEGQYEILGGHKVQVANVRILAATNRDIKRAVDEGLFREDLYYRLRVLEIRLPPLRERLQDLGELSLHFIRKYNVKDGKAIAGLEDDVLDQLKLHRWPGNVRELENVIQGTMIRCRGKVLKVEALPLEIRNLRKGDGRPGTAEAGPAGGEDATAEAEARALAAVETSHQETMDALERDRLIRALKETGGNKAKAARSLGMSRTTLFGRLKKHGLS